MTVALGTMCSRPNPSRQTALACVAACSGLQFLASPVSILPWYLVSVQRRPLILAAGCPEQLPQPSYDVRDWHADLVGELRANLIDAFFEKVFGVSMDALSPSASQTSLESYDWPSLSLPLQPRATLAARFVAEGKEGWRVADRLARSKATNSKSNINSTN